MGTEQGTAYACRLPGCSMPGGVAAADSGPSRPALLPPARAGERAVFQPRSALFQQSVGDDIRPVLEGALLQVRWGASRLGIFGGGWPGLYGQPWPQVTAGIHMIIHAWLGAAGAPAPHWRGPPTLCA